VGSKVEVWDLRDGSELPSKVITTPQDISSLAFSWDGTSLVTGDNSGLLLIWSIQHDVQTPIREYKGHTDKITALAVGADPHVLISGSWDETAKVWDSSEGTIKAILRDTMTPCFASQSRPTGGSQLRQVGMTLFGFGIDSPESQCILSAGTREAF
jgi:WD40 repeat protein